MLNNLESKMIGAMVIILLLLIVINNCAN